MGYNLHAIVRGAITAINPDVLGQWLESSGSTLGADYRPAPAWTYHDGVALQVQMLTGKELQHPALISVQGEKRSVYMFGTVQGVNKPQAKGGDLLQFRIVDGGPLLRWLVVTELEQWNPASSWSKIAVVLQTDPADNVVPDLLGLTLAAATAAIRAASFVAGTNTGEFSDTVAQGLVISSDPVAGTIALTGSPVPLVISLGPE